MNVENIPWSISRSNRMSRTRPREGTGVCSERRSFSASMLYLFSLTLLTLLSGCTFVTSNSNQQLVEEIPVENSLRHIVAYEGETLGLIAAWYTGDFSNWKMIKEHNEGLDPNRIMLGDVIEIPETLLVRDDSLPFRMVSERKKDARKTAEVKAVDSASSEKLADKVNDESEAGDSEEVEEPIAVEEKKETREVEAERIESETAAETIRIKSREELFEEMFD